jgi:hypothetical protein
MGHCSQLPTREVIGLPVIILVLLIFMGFGIDAVIHPKRHMNAYLRRGGEMLQDLNQTGVQIFGVILASGSGWVLYSVLRDVWSRCFA